MDELMREMWRLAPASLICSGSRYRDGSNNVLHFRGAGQDHSTAALTIAGSPAAAGKGGVVRFDGVDDECNNLSTNLSGIGPGTGEFTVMGFFRTSYTGAKYLEMWAYDYMTIGGINGYGIIFRTTNAGGVCNVYVAGTNIGSGTTDMRDNKLHFVVIQRVGTTVTVYVDFKVETSATAAGNVDTTTNSTRYLSLIQANNDTGSYDKYPGIADYWGLYNYAIPLDSQARVMRVGQRFLGVAA